MHMHLARLALSADPASFRRPTDVMRRVYGLQTGGGGGAWKLVMMWAEKGKGDGDQEVEQDTGGLGAEPAGEPLEEDLRLTTCVSQTASCRFSVVLIHRTPFRPRPRSNRP